MLLLVLQTSAGGPGHTPPSALPDLMTVLTAELVSLRNAGSGTLDSGTLLAKRLEVIHADTDAQGQDLNTDITRVLG